MDVPTAHGPRVFVGDGWEIRLTEGTIAAQDSASGEHTASESARSILSTIDPQRPLEEQAHSDADRPLVVGEAGQALSLVPDEQGTYWVVAFGDAMQLQLPSDRDRWRRIRDQLAEFISKMRVLAPLLDRRVRQSGEPSGVEIDDAFLGIARSGGYIQVELIPPAWCSDGEARRLIAIAAACISPTSGWRSAHDSDGGRFVALLGHEHAVSDLETS